VVLQLGGLGEVLTIPLRKKKNMLRITHKLRCFLWRQNNPEVNYSPTRDKDRWGGALVGTLRDFRVP